MSLGRVSKALIGVAVLAIASGAAFADVVDKKTILTTKETIEVPGAVLPPGEYVLKVVQLPSYAKKHVVQITNADETEVLSTVIAVPNSRLKVTGDTAFSWHEMPAGQPPALKAWFYPGENYGQEFAYPEARATELSAATKQEVPHISDEEAATFASQQQRETAVAPTPAPRAQSADNTAASQQARERELAAQRERDTQTQRDRERQTAQATQQTRERELAAQQERDMQAQRDRERQIAQATQNQQRNADPSLTAQQNQPTTTGNELPETAGLGVLFALIGLGALGASRAVRKLRSSK